MTEVRWSPDAASDLREIRLFIERDSPRYGRLVAERLYDSVSRLRTFPSSGRVVPEIARDDFREIVMGSYRIVYRVHSEHVEILTVFHSSRLIRGDLADR